MTLRLGWMSSCHPARHEAEHINSIQTANIADSNGLGVAIFAILSKKKRIRPTTSSISIDTVSPPSHWRVICTLAATWKGKKIILKLETISPKDSVFYGLSEGMIDFDPRARRSWLVIDAVNVIKV
jgi:hypothetical protein